MLLPTPIGLKKNNIESPFDLPLSVGIKTSGSFPVLISNTTLISDFSQKRKYLHLIDGAMTDNQGYATALDILEQESTSEKVLMIVDSDNTGNRHTFSKQERAQFSLSVYNRLAPGTIDAKRALQEEEIRQTGNEKGFVPLFFAFNILIKDNPAPVPKVIKKIKKEQDRLIDILQNHPEQLSYKDQQILYDLLTNIGTKYTISKREQALLLLAGQRIVAMQKNAILKALE